MKRRPARSAALAASALACAVAVSLPATAQANDRGSLLQRYQPVTVMDGVEQFAPTSVGSFVADAALETQTAPGVWQVVDATPTPDGLPQKPTAACVAQGLSPCYRLNQSDCSPAAGPA